MDPRHISINDYNYELPDERIAMYPLAERDASKLLVYQKGQISQTHFSEIDQYLPEETLLVLNNTKVINARIRFKKDTGAGIEIFCLEPFGNMTEYSSVMNARETVEWKCLVGGAAKWKEEILQKEIILGDKKIMLSAAKKEKLSEAYIIIFSWEPKECSFAEIVEAAGDVPLPPYIKRSTDAADSSRYQTIFAGQEGSVAAPTAGLHFSETVFQKLAAKNINKQFVTLHVGAGTFKPVKAESMEGHEMHAEYIDVTVEAIKNIRGNIGKVAAVGTTALRTIETLYWLGVKISLDKNIDELSLWQWDVYEEKMLAADLPAEQALDRLINWLQQKERENIFTKTQLLITPGYTFRVANMLITNFHQPRSTLLLLVAAAIGDDWKKMYEHALKNDFRFLSYGDGNLLFLNS